MERTETVTLTARLEQRVYPPYDDFHGTPHAMLWRRLTIETTAGSASLEQTDYGHPGRMNPWEPRGVAPALAGKLETLKGIASSLVALQG